MSQEVKTDDLRRKFCFSFFSTFSSLIEKSIKSLANQGRCKIPNLAHDAPEMMKFVQEEEPISCGPEEDWVACKMSICAIKKSVIEKKGVPVSCEFADVIRKDDYSFEIGAGVRSTSRYFLRDSDVVRVSCSSSDGSKWAGMVIGIRKSSKIIKRKRQVNDLNVLMLGFDSLSRNAFMRKLPKSYEYLKNNLKADVLEGYNIIGDGTPQALIPLLTGYTELELPETRKRKLSAVHVDAYPMIWKKFKEAGYLTAFNEDQPNIGTFTYRLKGFDRQPTDHYMRTYFLAIENELMNYKKLCVGSRPKHQVMLDYTKDFVQMYNGTSPSFAFSFHAELSHDSVNLIGVADDDVKNWLQDLKASGLLDNTILIMMSDHGNRFAEIRDTLQGKLEERLPFFSFVFPKKFKQKFPMLYRKFQQNVKRLTTPFDLHATLEDILSLQIEGVTKKSASSRAISLFRRIPERRSCADAYIEPHWCSCLAWQTLNDTSSNIVQRAAKAVIDEINKLTHGYRESCYLLRLNEVKWAAILAPQENLLHFKSSSDVDGFEADLSAQTKVDHGMYQLKIVTSPSYGIYEATVFHDTNSNEFHVKVSDISRINVYGGQARCIYSENPELRKFCYCK